MGGGKRQDRGGKKGSVQQAKSKERSCVPARKRPQAKRRFFGALDSHIVYV
jgi:hypothetical protein